jgi:hypothetical protein
VVRTEALLILTGHSNRIKNNRLGVYRQSVLF